MTRSLAPWFCALLLPLFGGCLLADVSIDENFDTTTDPLQGGASGAAGTGAMPPDNASGSGGSSGSSSNAGTGGSSAGSTATASGGGPTCMRTAPDISSYNPNREDACYDYCNLFTCICAGHPANTYSDNFDCLDTCNEALWPIGALSTIVPGTVSCRFWHAGLAVSQGVSPHCYHAAEVPSQGGCQVMP
jgi:hypothetical protein